MDKYSIGPSSYGDLKGVTQFVNSDRIAKQFRSLAYDYKQKFGQDGSTLSANEGMRSRPRQSLLYANFLRNGYPVAAVPFGSRHDEVNHGNAIDVGVTRADGTNRALTAEEFEWMHGEAEKRGFTWTGRYFNEPWHIEGATRAEQKAPYSDDILFGGGNTAKPSVPDDATTIAETDTMIRIIQDNITKKYYLENFNFGVREPIAVDNEDLADLTTVLTGSGRLPAARLDQLNERYFRKVGPLAFINLLVREGVFQKKGK